MTHTTHISYADDRSPSSRYNSRIMESRVSDWLARSFFSPTLKAAESRGEPNGDQSYPLPPTPVPLSLFPPTSSSTGMREYAPSDSSFTSPVCPTSPLQNGKDVYGNYIPSSREDYLATKSPPTSHDKQNHMQRQGLGMAASSSPMLRLRGGGWTDLRPFWKTTDTEEPQQEIKTTPLLTVGDHDALPQGMNALNDSGELESRPLCSVHSHFSAARSRTEPRMLRETHSGPFVMDTRQQDDQFEEYITGRRPGTQHTTSTCGSSEYRARVDAILNNHFGSQMPLRMPVPPPPQSDTKGKIEPQQIQDAAITVPSLRTVPRSEKRWDKKNLSPPPRSPLSPPLRYLEPKPVAYEYSHYSDDESFRVPSIMSGDTADDPLINLPGLKSSNAYRKVERDREIRRTQEQRRLHEEADCRHEGELGSIEEAQKQEPDRSTIVPDDSVTGVMRTRQLQPYELPRMATVDEQYRPSTPISISHSPRDGAVPVDKLRPLKNWHHQHHTDGHGSTIPATPAHTSKRRKFFRKVLAKTGRLTRLILAVPSDHDLKTYTRRPLPVEQIHEKRRHSGISADRNGWPRMNSSVIGPYGMTISPPLINLNNEFNYNRDRPATSKSDFVRSRRLDKNIPEQRDMEETWGGATAVRDFGSRNNEASGREFEIGNRSTGTTHSQNLSFPRNRVAEAKDSHRHAQVTNPLGVPAVHPRLSEDGNLVYTQSQNLGSLRRRPERITEEWLDGMLSNQTSIVGIRGGNDDDNNSKVLTTAVSNIFAPTLTPATTITSSPHPSLDEATQEAIAGSDMPLVSAGLSSNSEVNLGRWRQRQRVVAKKEER